ncbi:MAG: glycosyl transferase [Halobacteriovoraceae bacterium]|nr:glycosyl transferase [Halobacteriovoraceae bacterium]|tara:strand:- start:359 stop:955 length:597 start_codon:yes stop_codon:yes gene_type:complete
MKSLFDFSISIIAFTFFLPLFMVISALIKLGSKGPIFFKQVRVGKDGKEFKIFKFRTMITDAETKGLQLTVGKDPRITSIGHILRKYKLDELPQLINIIKGDMSFVGPRPEVPKYVSMYNEEQKKVLQVKPGITDVASLEYINENELLKDALNPEKMYIEKIMPAKLELNYKYIQNQSLFLDIKIIFQTIFKIMGVKI